MINLGVLNERSYLTVYSFKDVGIVNLFYTELCGISELECIMLCDVIDC